MSEKWEEKIISKIEKKLKTNGHSILENVLNLIGQNKYDHFILQEEDLSETIQLCLISKNPVNILKIKKPCNEAILLALDKQPYLLKLVNNRFNLSDEVIMYVLSKDFNLISEIENPSDKVKYFYLSQNKNLHYSLANWNYNDENLRKAVYQIDPTFIKYMSEHLTEKEYLDIIRIYPELACYKPESVKSIPEDLQREIIERVSPKILQYAGFLKIFDLGILLDEIKHRELKNDPKGKTMKSTLKHLNKNYVKTMYDDLDQETLYDIIQNKSTPSLHM